MGYESRDNCQSDITKAKSILDFNQLIPELVFDVMGKIRDKTNPQKRFMVLLNRIPALLQRGRQHLRLVLVPRMVVCG